MNALNKQSMGVLAIIISSISIVLSGSYFYFEYVLWRMAWPLHPSAALLWVLGLSFIISFGSLLLSVAYFKRHRHRRIRRNDPRHAND
jgi:hypothetical protein